MKAFDPKTATDAQEALKTIFGPIFEALLKGELENHLGYSSNDKTKRKIITGAMDFLQKHLKQPLELCL